MKNLQVDKNFGYYLFLFLMAFLIAAVIEETLKYKMVDRVKRKMRINYQVVLDYQIYAITASLGFSTMENLAYQVAAGFNSDSKILELLSDVVVRIFIAIPIHCLCGDLIVLRVIRRDIFKQSLSLCDVLKWSVFFHGNFNFWIIMIAVHKVGSSNIGWNALIVVLTAVSGCIVLRRERKIVAELQNFVLNKNFDGCWARSPAEAQ